MFNDDSTYPNLNGMEALGNTGFPPSDPDADGHLSANLVMIGFLLLGYWLDHQNPLSRYIYAIGGNESAARLASAHR